MTKWTPNLTRHKGPIYRSIAQALASDIEEGRLAPGTLLPTHRDLAGRLGVTIGTVTRAYAEATGWGLIDGQVGRGTYVRGRSELVSPPPIEDIDESQPVDMTLNLPPVPAGDPVRAALARTLDRLRDSPRLDRLLDYHGHAGLSHHRAAGAAWIRNFGYEVTPSQVLITTGAQHAINVVLGALLRPGDTLLVEAVTYPAVKQIAAQMQIRLQPVALDVEGILPDALEAASRGKGVRALYCIPTFHNPTGAVMSDERRRRLARIARARDFQIIEDDTFGLLAPRLPAPIASRAPERSFFIASTSKLLAPGLRIAYVAAPEAAVGALAERICTSTWMAPPLSAEIAAQWIEDRTADELIERHRREILARWKIAKTILGRHFPADPSPIPGYHLWVPVPAPWRAEAFAAHARSLGVAVLSAEAFATGPAPPPRAARVGLGAPRTRAHLERGLRRLVQVLETPAQETLSIV